MARAIIPTSERALIPGPDYLTELAKLGPRPGESTLAFHMRLSSIAAGREIVLQTAQRCSTQSEVFTRLGVVSTNGYTWLKQLGLTTRDIKEKLR